MSGTVGSSPSQHSALFYLFQEVSKLASPIHNAFVDADSSCPWLKDASLPGSFKAETEEREMCSFQISDHSGSPHQAPRNQTNVMDQSHDSRTTPESHSPWKVLSLINLQCNRLLRRGDAEESGPNSLLSSSPSTIGRLSKAAAKVTDQEVGSHCSSSAFSSQPPVLKHEKEETATCVSADEPVIDTGVGSNPQICVKVSREDSRQSQCAGHPETANRSSQFHHEENEEDKFSQSVSQVQAEEHLSSEERSEHLTGETISKRPKPTHNEFLSNHLTFSSNVEAVIFPVKPECTLDCNGNLSLPIEALWEPRLRPSRVSQSSWPPAALLPRVLTDQDRPPVEQGDSHREVPGALPVPQIADMQTNPSKCVEAKLEVGPGQKKDAADPATRPWRTKTPRKQPRPSRSVNLHDPDLQGVMFRMDPELDETKEHCRLLITSEYR